MGRAERIYAGAITMIIQTVAEPNLRDLLNLHTKEVMLALNCHAIATIQSFNPDNRSVTAKINYQKTFYVKDSAGNYKAQLVDYPLLGEVPVIILGGGDGSLTFPISEGDQCLILFNDRDISDWFSSETNTGAPATTRLHSIADGIALVGLNLVESYDNDRVVLKNGTTLLGLGESKIKLQNATTSLYQILNQLMTALTTFNTALNTAATAFGTNAVLEPAAAAGGVDIGLAATALQSSVTSIQMLVTGLLE